jgi:uncharacterized membrane protein YphA (DoxX/SURF4 family)
MILTIVVPCLVVALLLIGISAILSRRPGEQEAGWGRHTRFFLVLLRLAIGWHFLVEGIDKLNSPSWSSEAYLRESTGPLSLYFQELAGDSLLDRFKLESEKGFPKALAQDWENYFQRFVTHYELNEEQTKKAKEILEREENKLLSWLVVDSQPVLKKAANFPPVAVPMTIPQRMAQLAKIEARIRDLEHRYRPNFGPDTFAKLKEAKAEAKQARASLQADLSKQSAEIKNALSQVLAKEQKNLGPVPEPIPKPISQWRLLEWADVIVKYGLVAVGVGLVAGLFTRTACVAGAVFLLLFFLAMPPLPGWPESPRLEGHYLYINKNIIEMLALLVLASTRSGRWMGLDGLVQLIVPARQRESPVTPPTQEMAAP